MSTHAPAHTSEYIAPISFQEIVNDLTNVKTNLLLDENGEPIFSEGGWKLTFNIPSKQ